MNPSFLRKYDERLQRLEEQIKRINALLEPKPVVLVDHILPTDIYVTPKLEPADTPNRAARRKAAKAA
jgi:hypothetical protein